MYWMKSQKSTYQRDSQGQIIIKVFSQGALRPGTEKNGNLIALDVYGPVQSFPSHVKCFSLLKTHKTTQWMECKSTYNQYTLYTLYCCTMFCLYWQSLKALRKRKALAFAPQWYQFCKRSEDMMHWLDNIEKMVAELPDSANQPREKVAILK